jgi:tetratricopeptide (TPR) repeat protein
MHSTRFGGLRWVLAVAVVWLAGSGLVVSLAGESPPASSTRASETGGLKQPAGAMLSSGPTDGADAALSREGPTLAPPRRNTLREPARPGVVPARGSNPAASPSSSPASVASPPAKSSSPPASPEEKPLRAVPQGEAGSTEVEAASFNGVTPGVSTIDDVEKHWGKPKEVKRNNQSKVASIVIRLNRAFPAEGVAQQLALSHLRPVLVSNDLGEILGQVYPERGVVFSFEPSTGPGKATMKVAQIILEPIAAEPFLLRAETNLDSQPEATLRDLDEALKVSPENGRAHWLKARLLVLSGETAKAIAAADAAVRLEPNDAQYVLTRAQIFGQAGRFPEAMRDAERGIALSGERLHVKARAQCLMGDLLGSGPKPDYKRASEYHIQAIKTADPLAASPHPAVRLPAKEVLIDAHLGAAHDVAWGPWNQKQMAVPTWLGRASAFAEELIKSDGGTNEHRFRVATRALAACVGTQGKLDPDPWCEQAVRVGEELIQTAEAGPRRQFQWELGMALYDAVQICQTRNDRDKALKYGQQAIEYLEKAQSGRGTPADAYLLGRLYFRLGSIHSLGKQDHKSAIAWFDKAVPTLQRVIAEGAPVDLGRLGETFVSMGVSYWETGQRQEAVKLTQQGVELMENAVKQGQLSRSALDVPYANLATMHRHLNQDREAEKYLERSSATKPGATRR